MGLASCNFTVNVADELNWVLHLSLLVRRSRFEIRAQDYVVPTIPADLDVMYSFYIDGVSRVVLCAT